MFHARLVEGSRKRNLHCFSLTAKQFVEFSAGKRSGAITPRVKTCAGRERYKILHQRDTFESACQFLVISIAMCQTGRETRRKEERWEIFTPLFYKLSPSVAVGAGTTLKNYLCSAVTTAATTYLAL